MRLHALIFAFLVLQAHAASLPDKKDIEKKLTDAVKEVLNKDEVPVDNTFSDHELIDQANSVKEIENNLRNGVQVANIPVKVVVEDVKPALTTEDKKEDNEVSDSAESSEIKRPEVDLKNPGPPQRMQHDNQNPENFKDAQNAVENTKQNLNSWWRSSPQYSAIIEDLNQLRKTVEKQIDELSQSVQNYWTVPASSSSEQPATVEVEQKEKEEEIKLRASVKADSTTQAPSTGIIPPFGQGPFATFFAQFQENIQRLNETMNSYIQNLTINGNNTNINNGGFGSNFLNFGSGAINLGGQPSGNQSSGTQGDDSRPPQNGFWPNLQNIFTNPFQPSQPPANVQSDQPQQPNRPVVNAIQNVLNLWQPRPPAATAQPAAQPTPAAQPSETPANPESNQEGTNAVPTESKPEVEKEKEKEKEKPEQTPQPVTQSGPIKQFIGKNPIVQGIAGAVQRLQHTIMPEKPRDDQVKDAGIKEDEATKGSGAHKPGSGVSGDNNNVDSSGIELKSKPEEEKQEAPAAEPTMKEEVIPAPVVPEKTE